MKMKNRIPFLVVLLLITVLQSCDKDTTTLSSVNDK